MRTFDPELIIDSGHAAVTQALLKEDQIIDVYLHNSAGSVAVSGGSYGSQAIETVTWTDSDFSYVQNFYTELDNRLDIDFRFTSEQSTADVAIFLDKEIDTGSGNGNTLGLAVSNYSDSNGYYWELFLNKPAFGENNTDYFRYALIHEIGHSLGLEHPFEDSDGDAVDGNTDPWTSLYPEDTVMAYRNPSSGEWPTALTENDWAALKKLWGREMSLFDTTVTIDGDTHSVPSETQALTNSFLVNSNQFTQSTDVDGNGNALVQQTDMTVQTSHWAETFAVNRVARAGSAGDYIQGKQLVYQMGEINNNSAVVSFERAGSILQGSDASDTIRGLAGTDIIDAKGGDDLVHGGNAADVISGGSGADELHGDFGKNTYLDQADGSVDLIAIKSDQHLHNWWIGSDGNNANGQKADVIERLDANDQIKIIGAATEDLDFRQASIHGLSGIGIFADGSLEAIYTGGDLSAQQLQSMTTGDASNAAMNNQIWSYNFGNETPPVI